MGQHAGRDAIDLGVKTLGVERGGVGAATAVAVLDETDALGLLAQFGDALGAETAEDHGAEIVLRAVGEFVLEEPHVVANI